MLTANSQPASDYTYHLETWGDVIFGSREALQALGLGVGMAFPSEPGGRRRALNVVDPRGFPCTISLSRSGLWTYCAAIHFPGRQRPSDTRPYAPGVTLEHLWWSDLYTGASDALISAGLVSATQFPGAPGLGKTVASFKADGSPAPIGRRVDSAEPGTMTIRRFGKNFNVYLHVDADECERRNQERRARELAYEKCMVALPRPAPLVAADRQSAAHARRAQMRLAWSRPAWVPTITVPL